MKIALDPFCHADHPVEEMPRIAADMGFEYLELCTLDDFVPEYFPPRANANRIHEFKRAMSETGVKLALDARAVSLVQPTRRRA